MLEPLAKIAGTEIFHLGPAYTLETPVFDIFDVDLGSIYENDFDVPTTPVPLDPFVFGRPLTDLAVSVVGQPSGPVIVSAASPTPPIDYTVRVRNDGPATATSVVLQNRLPSQLTVNPARSTPGVSVNNAYATFNVGALASGEFRDVIIAGNYVPGSGGQVSDRFVVFKDQLTKDPDPADNAATAATDMQLPLIIQASNESELRAAINQTNNAPGGGDVPVINVTGNVTPTQGEYVVTRSVTIRGANASFAGGTASRVFRLGGFGAQTYRLETISIDRANGRGQNEGYGGAIQFIDGDGNDILSITDGRILNSTALTGGGQGGAIYVDGARLIIEGGSGGTILAGNQANFGGAIMLHNGTATLNGGSNFGVRLDHNLATVRGGGIDLNPYGTAGTANLMIENSRFERNQAPFGAAISNVSDNGEVSTATYLSSTFSTAAVSTPDTPQFGIPLFTARHDHRAVTGQDGRIYVLGGVGSDFGLLNSVEAYDPAALAWTPLAPMPITLYLKPGRTLDFEAQPTIPIHITAIDRGGLTVTNSFTVNVRNVPEAPREIIGGNGLFPANQAGARVGRLTTLGPPGIAAAFTYSVDDPRFEVATDTLKLKSGNSLSPSSTPVTLHVTARDANGLSVVQTFEATPATQVTVQAPAIPVLSVGTPFSAQFTAQGGRGGPFEFSFTSGALPNGLTLSSAGLLSGTPTASGNSSFKVTATDSSGLPGSFTIQATTVNPDSTPPTLSGVPSDRTVSATGASGAAVTFTLPTATDAVDPTPTVSCNPPSGSTFAIGTTTVTCTATDDANNSASATFTVIVLPSDNTAPTIDRIDLVRDARGKKVLRIVLTFSEPLTKLGAESLANYSLESRTGRKVKRIALGSAVYNASTVTLTPAKALSASKLAPVFLTSRGTGTLTDASPNLNPLDGDRNGAPGGDFVRSLAQGPVLSMVDEVLESGDLPRRPSRGEFADLSLAQLLDCCGAIR